MFFNEKDISCNNKHGANSPDAYANVSNKFIASSSSGQWDRNSNYISISGMIMEALSYASTSSANYTPKYAYNGMAQAEAAAAKFLGKMAKITKHAGIFANALTTAYSGYKVVDQYKTGGIKKSMDGI